MSARDCGHGDKAVSVRLSDITRIVCGLWLLIVACPAVPSPEPDLFQTGVRLYDERRYAQAVDALRSAVQADPDNSENHHWLGKAYGRLAEEAPWHKAFSLARKAGKEMERAVELDPRNEAALRSLLMFYDQAPAIVGGGREKAERLRTRMRALGFNPD